MKTKIIISAICCVAIASADTRLPEYGQVAGVSNQVAVIDAKVDELIEGSGESSGLEELTERIDALSVAYAQTGKADFAIVDVSLNVNDSGYEIPSSERERAEILSDSYIAISSPGYLPIPLKGQVTSLVNFQKRFIVPMKRGGTNTVTVSFVPGRSETCAYHATPVSIRVEEGGISQVALSTEQIAGEGAIVEVCRIQPYTSTANDSGDSWLARKVTTERGTKLHLGYYDHTNAFIKDAGIRVDIYTVPTNAETKADCTIAQAYGSSVDEDIFGMLKVLNEEKIVDVIYRGDTESVTNKFVRFSPVWVKTTYETVAIPRRNEFGEDVSTNYVPSVIRWFCNVQADADYHMHSAFVRYIRNGDAYGEEQVPYTYISRYPINNMNLTCGGAQRAIAISRSDGSQEVGNTRQGFLDRCRNVNNADIDVVDNESGNVVLTVGANSDPRAMSMIDLPAMSLIEDLAYLLFGIDAQSQLRGVSIDNAAAKAQQVNGSSDFIANLGIKLGGYSPSSSGYNFNFLDIEGGTWSAPGCMFPNYTSIMERITTTDQSGVPTSTTRNRYIVAIDRLDYNPASSDVENLTGNGYRYVSFNVGSSRRIGMDDTQVMRDAKLFCTSQTEKNINYAGVDNHWQGSAPAAIANYSSATTYNENSYAVYEGKLYQCTTAVTSAETFDPTKWALQENKTIIARSAFLVARGAGRANGANLGAVALNAGSGLSYSGGYYWRSRLSFMPLQAANDE